MTGLPPSIVIFPTDCRQLPLEYVAKLDVMLTDPPYSKKVHSKAVSCSASDGYSNGIKERDFGFSYLTPDLRRTLGKFASVVKRWSVLYSDVESAQWLRVACEAAGAEYIRTLPWTRWSQPQTSGDRPMSGVEDLIITHRQDLGDYEPDRVVMLHRQYIGKRGGIKPIAKSWNGLGNIEAFEHKSLRGEEKYSAEKPLDQALDLVCYFSNYGEIVFDPCAGSGTHARACQILGRKFVGCESLQEAYIRATTRLASPLAKYEIERVERFIEKRSEVQRLLEQSGDNPGLENSRRRYRSVLADLDRAEAYLK